VSYGYSAESPDERLLAQWNRSAINFYQGKNVPEKEMTAAFAGTPAK
jgi:hypothetical protein